VHSFSTPLPFGFEFHCSCKVRSVSGIGIKGGGDFRHGSEPLMLDEYMEKGVACQWIS